jgi:hypothetical protein
VKIESFPFDVSQLSQDYFLILNKIKTSVHPLKPFCNEQTDLPGLPFSFCCLFRKQSSE